MILMQHRLCAQSNLFIACEMSEAMPPAALAKASQQTIPKLSEKAVTSGVSNTLITFSVSWSTLPQQKRDATG